MQKVLPIKLLIAEIITILAQDIKDFDICLKRMGAICSLASKKQDFRDDFSVNLELKLIVMRGRLGGHL